MNGRPGLPTGAPSRASDIGLSHAIVTVQSLPVEVQVRTELQDLWAQTFERLADAYGRGIRYGQEPLPDPAGTEQTEERRSLVATMYELSDDVAFIEAERTKLDGRKPGMQQLGAGVVESIQATREYEARTRRMLESVAQAAGRTEAS